jgi:hypothetical protein
MILIMIFIMILILIILILTVAFAMKSNYKNNLPLFLKGLLNQIKHHSFITLNCKNTKLFQTSYP